MMTQDLNDNQKIPKKVSGQESKEIAIIQVESADEERVSAKIIQAIKNLKEQGHRIDWYWYPASLAPAELEIEIADLKPHYDEVIIV